MLLNSLMLCCGSLVIVYPFWGAKVSVAERTRVLGSVYLHNPRPRL